MISKDTKTYLSAGVPDFEIGKGFHFPDAIIDAVAQIKFPVIPPITSSPLPALPLNEAMLEIIEALNNFLPELGQRAQKILNNPGQVENVKAVEKGKATKMFCQQAGLSKDYLMQRGMLSAEYSNEAINDGVINNKDFATIHLDYDKTFNGAAWLAHELGHAIADDIQGKAGFDYVDNPIHMEEVQAYIVQNIFRNHLMKSEESAIASQAKSDFHGEVQDYKDYFDEAKTSMPAKHGRYTSSMIARVLINALEDNESARAHVMDLVMGKYGPKNITEVLAAAGIETTAQLNELANQAGIAPMADNQMDNSPEPYDFKGLA